MNRLLAAAAAGEALMGLFLIWIPSIVVRLLLGDEIMGAGLALSRIAGIALIALAVACWPSTSRTHNRNQAYAGMLTYSILTTLYLAYIGLAGKLTGKLLWPAVVVHAILTLLLGFAWSRIRVDSEIPTDG